MKEVYIVMNHNLPVMVFTSEAVAKMFMDKHKFHSYISSTLMEEEQCEEYKEQS